MPSTLPKLICQLWFLPRRIRVDGLLFVEARDKAISLCANHCSSSKTNPDRQSFQVGELSRRLERFRSGAPVRVWLSGSAPAASVTLSNLHTFPGSGPACFGFIACSPSCCRRQLTVLLSFTQLYPVRTTAAVTLQTYSSQQELFNHSIRFADTVQYLQ